ncbi:unnamed protein product [Thelazia callipaeda]|uniref:C2H2-type domain-containing protein n=1 Tax=Thelazia callipaeda TaxID=103827 RepID=A0A0N5D917_THECL|nr:unnamed protein product [Thelazia callipaeda]
MGDYEGYCIACGHFLTFQSTFTAAQKLAAIGLHLYDWCLKASKPILEERRVKWRGLELAEMEKMAQHFFIPPEEEGDVEDASVPAEQEFNEEEAVWAPLPDDDNADCMVKEERSEPANEPSEVLIEIDNEEPQQEFRELVLRNKTVAISVPLSWKRVVMASEAFRAANSEGLPHQFKRKLQDSTNAHRWQSYLSCFCAICGHYLAFPSTSMAAHKQAAVEIYAYEWCPRAHKSVLDESKVRRRRLQLLGRRKWRKIST